MYTVYTKSVYSSYHFIDKIQIRKYSRRSLILCKPEAVTVKHHN